MEALKAGADEAVIQTKEPHRQELKHLLIVSAPYSSEPSMKGSSAAAKRPLKSRVLDARNANTGLPTLFPLKLRLHQKEGETWWYTKTPVKMFWRRLLSKRNWMTWSSSMLSHIDKAVAQDRICWGTNSDHRVRLRRRMTQARRNHNQLHHVGLKPSIEGQDKAPAKEKATSSPQLSIAVDLATSTMQKAPIETSSPSWLALVLSLSTWGLVTRAKSKSCWTGGVFTTWITRTLARWKTLLYESLVKRILFKGKEREPKKLWQTVALWILEKQAPRWILSNHLEL